MVGDSKDHSDEAIPVDPSKPSCVFAIWSRYPKDIGADFRKVTLIGTLNGE